jgi:chromosome partitioning protein
MKVISFTNHKGGVGKSTSTLNVGYALAAQGHKVLLIDCDAQCNLTMCFQKPLSGGGHIGAVLEAQSSATSVIRTVGSNLGLLPATPALGYLEKVIGAQQGYEYLLREALESVKQDYDYCLIDTPPSLSALTYTALVASDAVFIPAQPEFFGFEGLQTILEACARLQKRTNPQLHIGGIFFTKYSKKYRRKLHHDIVDATTERFASNKLVMNTSIRDNVALAEAQIQRQSIYDYAPVSNGAQDYLALTEEIISRLS